LTPTSWDWLQFVFLILTAIFGRHVFAAIRWIFLLGILGFIGLLVLAGLIHPNLLLKLTPIPTPNYSLMREDATVEPSPTPKLLTAQEESQLFDYGFDEESNTQVHNGVNW
jgi:hypothetical protein